MLPTSAQAQRFNRGLVLLAVAAISLLSWYYLFRMAFPAGGHSASMAVGGIELLTINAVMWTVMMIAMMLPTATPMVLGFLRVQHQRRSAGTTLRLAGIFVAGYLLAWSTFSVVAAVLQWWLYQQRLMTSVMGNVTPLLAAGVLIAAGLFQWSGLKDACLTRCQSPLGFLLNEWRDGDTGALRMGLRHGLFCIGCCWLLMLLMFVGGVMNLLWMAAITVYVLAEKLIPQMQVVGRLTGVVLVIAGTLTALSLLLM